jgi:dynein heavy chain
VRQKLTKL